MDKYCRVELQPQKRELHLASHCGPDYDLVMINHYSSSALFLTPGECRRFAKALLDCAYDTEHRERTPSQFDPAPSSR